MKDNRRGIRTWDVSEPEVLANCSGYSAFVSISQFCAGVVPDALYAQSKKAKAPTTKNKSTRLEAGEWHGTETCEANSRHFAIEEHPPVVLAPISSSKLGSAADQLLPDRVGCSITQRKELDLAAARLMPAVPLRLSRPGEGRNVAGASTSTNCCLCGFSS